jgi:hypothetical protein
VQSNCTVLVVGGGRLRGRKRGGGKSRKAETNWKCPWADGSSTLFRRRIGSRPSREEGRGWRCEVGRRATFGTILFSGAVVRRREEAVNKALLP